MDKVFNFTEKEQIDFLSNHLCFLNHFLINILLQKEECCEEGSLLHADHMPLEHNFHAIHYLGRYQDSIELRIGLVETMIEKIKNFDIKNQWVQKIYKQYEDFEKTIAEEMRIVEKANDETNVINFTQRGDR